ncbi:MAG: methyltransferase [Vicinamibacterales bacterium]
MIALGHIRIDELTAVHRVSLMGMVRGYADANRHGLLVDPSFHGVFVQGERVAVASLTRTIGTPAVDACLACGLLERDGPSLFSRFRCHYVEGFSVFTDPRDGPRDDEQYLDPLWEGPKFERFVIRQRVAAGLDLGCGCGNYALLLSRFCDTVEAVDVNVRAIAVTQLNAAINGIDNLGVRHGTIADLQGARQFGCIVSTVPCGFAHLVRGTNRLLAGDDQLTAETLSGIAQRLSEQGWAHALAALPREQPLEYVRRWLGDDRFEIFGMPGALRLPDYVNVWLYIRRGPPRQVLLPRLSITQPSINPVDHVPGEWLSELLLRLVDSA